jgi:hypothetical protein
MTSFRCPWTLLRFCSIPFVQLWSIPESWCGSRNNSTLPEHAKTATNAKIND